MEQGSVSAHSAGAYTATLLVMVNVKRGGWRAPPTLTSQGRFYPHHWMSARKQRLQLSATGIFRRCSGKTIVHRSDTNLQSSDYQPNTLPMRHCYLVPISNFKSFYAGVSSVWPISGIHALALDHDVAGIHAIESVSCVVSPTVTSVHALVFTHALAGTHALACASEVVGSSVAGVFALWMLQHDVLAVTFFPSPCRKSLPDSSGPWKEAFYIPQCREILVPGAGKVSLQRPDFYGMEECKMSHSRDRKTFQAFGNAKVLLPGTRRIFGHGECK